MSGSKIVDARGLSCPQPAMLARQALEGLSKGTLEIVVDTATARENVSRIAGHLGWEVQFEEKSEGNCRILLRK
ncbi:sulfurtransferase TusA family protein [Chloroflexota bacterium]